MKAPILEEVIRTTLIVRRLSMHEDEITSLAREVADWPKWHGRELTKVEAIEMLDVAIQKMATAA